MQAADLVLAADHQRRRPSRLARTRPLEPRGRLRRLSPFDRNLADRLEVESPDEALGGGVTNEDRPRVGQRLETRGDVRRVPESDRPGIGGAHEADGVGLDGAAVLLHRHAHHRHALADERLHFVRGEPLPERSRADDVGEEHGDRAQLVAGASLGHEQRLRRCSY